MNNKKLLINTPHFELFGGVASYYNVLKPFLNDRADFFYIGSRGEKKLIKKIRRIFLDYFFFLKKIRKNDYDLLLLNPSFDPKSIFREGFFLLLSKIYLKKVLVFIHGWEESFANGIKKIQIFFFSIVYRKADAMIVLANEFEDRIRKMGVTSPIYLETTIVDDSYFSKYSLVTTRKPEDPFNILFLSRIEKSKGVYLTLKVYKILKRSYPFVKLTVAGDGTEFEGVRRYILEKGIADVSLLGYVRGEQKRRVFSNADCYIFPTAYGEGMPTSVLEAMAIGLPVITRPVGGLMDFFEDGKMGFLTKSLDPKMYAQYIEQLIANPELCMRIGQFNREYAKERFAASQVGKRLEMIFDSVCGK